MYAFTLIEISKDITENNLAQSHTSTTTAINAICLAFTINNEILFKLVRDRRHICKKLNFVLCRQVAFFFAENFNVSSQRAIMQ